MHSMLHNVPCCVAFGDKTKWQNRYTAYYPIKVSVCSQSYEYDLVKEKRISHYRGGMGSAPILSVLTCRGRVPEPGDRRV